MTRSGRTCAICTPKSHSIAQLLSHSAGLRRDAADASYFQDRRPAPDIAEVLSDLNAPPVIEPNTRFKYSNHGYALLGLAIETITGEPYRDWVKREIIAFSGLQETEPDMPIPDGTPFARGHTGELLTGKRMVIPGDQSLAALAPAGGVVSTAADVARFFAQLLPKAEHSVLSVASRREMTRRQWRNPHASLEQWYGLGTMSGSFEGWDWFGHGGGLRLHFANLHCTGTGTDGLRADERD
jgi:CubicO group peptidase (beta-lactamase class C family)